LADYRAGAHVEGIAAGICVGCLMGILTGMMTLLILMDAFAPRSKEISHLERIFGRRQPGVRLATKLSMVMPFWFGGSWLTSHVMNGLSWKEMGLPYLITLVVVYMLIMIAPVSRLIARLWRKT
jgi:hypothetical protein